MNTQTNGPVADGAVLQKQSRLEHFPVSFFSMIMGLLGFTIMLQKAEILLAGGPAGSGSAGSGQPAAAAAAAAGPVVSTIVLYITLGLFVLLAGFYTAKLLRHPAATRSEFNNPVRLNFFPTITISLLLFAVAFLEYRPSVSLAFWTVGAALHLLATLVILTKWIRQTKFEINQFNPAWFIPVVGNLLVPVAGVAHAPVEISWFFFSIGIVFWIPLFTIFLYRIIFHHPMPEKLLPTFFILIAPPSLGFVSYVKLSGALDNFATVLYFFALFLVILLLAQIPMLYRLRFYLSWWAYSFPIASAAIASMLMYHETGSDFYRSLFFAIGLPLTALVLVLLAFTVRAVRNGEICVAEG